MYFLPRSQLMTTPNCPATKDEQHIRDAWALMDSVIAHLTVDGGVKEACDEVRSSGCNADQQAFKGIMMYYMCVPHSPTHDEYILNRVGA